MKIIKTVKGDKTTTEYKLNATDYTLIIGILGSIKFVVKSNMQGNAYLYFDNIVLNYVNA